MILSEIDVLILSGGRGERLRPLVKDSPKALVEIKGHPFLDYLVAYLIKSGFKRIIICTGYMSEKIKDYYSNKDMGVEILFSDEEKPLGTAGAVKNAEHIIKSNPFVVMNGDSFCQVDFLKFSDFHSAADKSISIVLVKTKNSGKDFGAVKMDDSGRIISFKEKIDTEGEKLVNAGIYLFDKKVLEMIPQGKKFSLEYYLFPVIKECYGYVSNETFLDIGTPERLKNAENILPEANSL